MQKVDRAIEILVGILMGAAGILAVVGLTKDSATYDARGWYVAAVSAVATAIFVWFLFFVLHPITVRVSKWRASILVATRVPRPATPREGKGLPPRPKEVELAPLPSSNPRSSVGERIQVPDDVTPQSMRALWRGRTAAQAHKLTEEYLGQWITVRGPVGNIGVWNGRFVMVLIYADGDRPYIALFFHDESVVDRLSALNAGDAITVFGRIDGIEANGLSLYDCELVRIG